MKKNILLLTILMMGVFILSGCEKKETTNTPTENEKTELTLLYNKVNILPGTEFKKSSIEEEAEYSEIPSCAFEGIDKVYKYADLEITTSEIDGKEKIYSVYFISEKIKTTEGLAINDSKSLMVQKYGSNYDEFGQKYSYNKDRVEISFIVEDDLITSIEYTLLID